MHAKIQLKCKTFLSSYHKSNTMLFKVCMKLRTFVLFHKRFPLQFANVTNVSKTRTDKIAKAKLSENWEDSKCFLVIVENPPIEFRTRVVRQSEARRLNELVR